MAEPTAERRYQWKRQIEKSDSDTMRDLLAAYDARDAEVVRLRAALIEALGMVPLTVTDLGYGPLGELRLVLERAIHGR